MKSLSIRLNLFLAILLTAAVTAGFLPQTRARATGPFEAPASEQIEPDGHSHWSASSESSNFIIEAAEEGTSCRDASGEEAAYFSDRSPDLVLQPMNDFTVQAEGGLNIVLRGTAQLESFPEAKQAFLRAAATWQSLIQTPITVIVDVDFGPKRFGLTYPTGVLGSTMTQSLGNAQGYLSLRNKMIASGANTPKAALYNSLPAANLPTDIGALTALVTPSATLRVIGEINSVANPSLETNFGNPPSIGFNSNFPFDFDPSDGIDSEKVDFDAVAVHEIGHVLGFASQAGMKEMSPSSTASASVWDVFRFRPDVTMGQFVNATRVLTSGGEQVFYAGGATVPLSTGRPNGTGGDGQQASHWKDDAFTGITIGVMDPTLGRGQRSTITINDLAVLDAICYRINPNALPPSTPGSAQPVVHSVSGELDGNTLRLTVNAQDGDGNLAQVFSSLLDGSDRVVTENSFDIGGDTATSRVVTLNLGGMGQVPSAVKVKVSVIDSEGNRSNTTVFDFSVADQGGPELRSGNFDPSGVLSLKGGPFMGELELEVNGVIVAPPIKIKRKGGGKKLKISGRSSDLNLRSGPNRIRMIDDNLRSNILIITL
jgi:hypothetical protein